MSIEPPQDKLSAFTEVPVIDISGAHDPARRAALAKDMVKVAQEVGFMYVVGHGIDQKLVDDVFGMSKTFFALPDEEKRRIHLTKSKAYRGYIGLRERGNDPTFQGNNLEAFNCADEAPDDEPALPLRGKNLWPQRPDNFRDVVYAYFQNGYRLGETLLALLAEGLGEPSDTFLKHYGRSISYLRLLRYAQIDDPSVKLLARPHYDTGVITILAQDPSGGLEILNKAGGLDCGAADRRILHHQYRPDPSVLERRPLLGDTPPCSQSRWRFPLFHPDLHDPVLRHGGDAPRR